MPDPTRKKDTSRLPDPENLPEFILTDPEPIEIAEGYSINIKYDNEGRPNIYIKKYGDFDTRGFRRRIERGYPGATIQGLEKPKEIEMVDSQNQKTLKSDNKTRKTRRKSKRT